MKLLSHLKTAAALAVIAAMTPTAVSAQALRAEVGKPLQAAARALAARNTGAALQQVNAARAAASSANEKAKVAQMAAAVYTASRQYDRAAQELESSGTGTPTQLAQLYYQSGKYDKAIALARRGGGPDNGVLIAQSYVKTGRNKEAAAQYQALIRQYGAKENYLSSLASAQFKAGDKKAYLETTTRLVKVDPSPARWYALLANLKGEQMSREAKLGLYELIAQTNNLKLADDYLEYAKLAIVSNQPGTAKAALDKGRAGGVLPANDPRVSGVISAAGARAAQAQASVAKQPPAMQANTYFGMGDYPKAIAAYSKAPPSDATKLQLGIAQLKAGQTAAARTTFNAIPQNSQVKDIAAMWALYASTRG